MKNPLNVSDIFSEIKSDFTSLWGYKDRGQTLEIITPFSILSGSFISVFLTMREDNYIVTDGQRVMQIIEDLNLDQHRSSVQVYLDKTSEHYGIKKTIGSNKSTFYFKITTDIKMLTAYIYDLAHFQIAALNSIFSSQVFFENELTQDYRFSTRVNKLIKQKIEDSTLNNKGFVFEQNSGLSTFQFNTILRRSDSSCLWAAMCITGSTPAYFCTSMGRAHMGFGYVRSQPELKNLVIIAAIFDETAKGYDLGNERVKAQKEFMMNQCCPASYTFDEFERINDLGLLYREKSGMLL